MASYAAFIILLSCIIWQGSGSPTFAALNVAADDRADVYLNGNPIMYVRPWGGCATYHVFVSPGDVISIIARDIGSVRMGVIADLKYRGYHCGTKVGSGPWKMRRDYLPTAFLSPFQPYPVTPIIAGQMLSSFNPTALSWPFPGSSNVVVGLGGSSVCFPFTTTGASYVWRESRAPSRSVVFLRLTVPESCSQVSTTTTATTTTTSETKQPLRGGE